jgi:hypothetical protein
MDYILYGADTWIIRSEIPEMWWWKCTEKISLTDHVRKEVALQTVKEERNILTTIKRRKANWIGCLLSRNCLINHVIEGKIEERVELSGRRARKC